MTCDRCGGLKRIAVVDHSVTGQERESGQEIHTIRCPRCEGYGRVPPPVGETVKEKPVEK